MTGNACGWPSRKASNLAKGTHLPGVLFPREHFSRKDEKAVTDATTGTAMAAAPSLRPAVWPGIRDDRLGQG